MKEHNMPALGLRNIFGAKLKIESHKPTRHGAADFARVSLMGLAAALAWAGETALANPVGAGQ